jgi:hypothetical protein
MTDPIGERSDDVDQVSGRAHQPVEAGEQSARQSWHRQPCDDVDQVSGRAHQPVEAGEQSARQSWHRQPFLLTALRI